MNISKDLFLSILAMDAYNRGYGSGLNIQGSTIGSATITTDSEREFRDLNAPLYTLTKGRSAGFYAISYTISGAGTDLDGKTVISYRGTDKNIPTLTGSGSDLINGYGLALGSCSPRPILEGPADSSFRAGLH